MGVRFECPNGHQLNVKAHLSGKRGICPACGARFVVPAFSGGRVAEAPEEAPTNGATADALGEAAWYVRPAAGGQFGPVDSGVFEQWVREGRVAADSWVWRTGWTDWRPGRDALAVSGAASSSAAAPSVDSSIDLTLPAQPARGGELLPVPKKGEALSTAKRRRQQLNHRLTLVLGVVAVVLIVTLAVVLSR